MSTVKPFTARQIFKPLERSALFVARELQEAAKNDPALAMRFTAGALVNPIMSGVNPDVAVTTGETIVPVVRAGLLALNGLRAYQTFQDPESKGYEKALDVIRVVSDTAGLVGGLAMLFTPQYAALGAKMMGTAYSVDIVSHAFRGLTHAGDRIKVWQAEAAALKPDTGLAPKTEESAELAPAPSAATPRSNPNLAPLAVLEQPKSLNLWKS